MIVKTCVLSLLFAGALGWVPALGAEPMEELTAGDAPRVDVSVRRLIFIADESSLRLRKNDKTR